MVYIGVCKISTKQIYDMHLDQVSILWVHILSVVGTGVHLSNCTTGASRALQSLELVHFLCPIWHSHTLDNEIWHSILFMTILVKVYLHLATWCFFLSPHLCDVMISSASVLHVFPIIISSQICLYLAKIARQTCY